VNIPATMDLANTLSAVEVVSQTSSGALRCEEIARACLDRVSRRDSVTQAWSFLDADLVVRRAKELDARAVRGPLHGVPVGVKDIVETCDMPTEMGSPIYQGYQSIGDASCVALLRAAGALIFGKTVTCEFAGVTAGPTTNPHDPARTPGGSSSGSAAAVADFMVPLAIGTQTGGSVQRPASYCGVVGYKPTFGLINSGGVKPAAESLDTVGLFARTVEDIELSARVLTNSAPVVWYTQCVPLRIGLCRTFVWDSAEQPTRDAIEDAALRLAGAGFQIRDLDLPRPCKDLTITREIINDFERARSMAYEWNAFREKLSERLAKTIANGWTIPLEQYLDAVAHVDMCRRLAAEVFADFDVLLAPTVQGEAPTGLTYTGDHRFQSIWTQLRTPTVSLPTHAGPNGMPISIQLVGRPYADNDVLKAAQLIFRTLGRGPAVKS